MKRRLLIWLCLLGSFLLVGGICRQSPEASSTATPMAQATRNYQRYTLADLCSNAEGGIYVEVQGMLKVPESIVQLMQSYRVPLAESLDEDAPEITLVIPLGQENNHIHPVPEEYQASDFKVQKADGTIVGHGDTVTVQGQFRGGIESGICQVTVQRIE